MRLFLAQIQSRAFFSLLDNSEIPETLHYFRAPSYVTLFLLSHTGQVRLLPASASAQNVSIAHPSLPL